VVGIAFKPSCRDLFVIGPGPDGSGSKPELPEGWAHTPEKSGIDAVLGCADAADDNRAAAAVVAIFHIRMMVSSRSYPADFAAASHK
jgi:hypothetical protein